MDFPKFRRVSVCAIALLAKLGFADQAVYSDALANSWENWSWATVNLSATSPTHAGAKSIAVTTASAWQALYLHHAAFDSSGYTHLSFWIHGGATGGQKLQVQAELSGAAQTAVALAPLVANTWQHYLIPFTSLGVANQTTLDGFWIQDAVGTSQPTFYVDDITLVSAPPPSAVSVSVDATQVIRTVDARLFGLNAAAWDNVFDTANTISLLTDLDNQALRFPGGSMSNEYHWATNTTGSNTWQWATSFDQFAHVATSTRAQVFISVNYGTGTAAEAAAWVRYSNLTKGYAFKYWEVGNENYGAWETDTNQRPHDPFIYATRFKDYYNQMKAVDPTIRIGAVVDTNEDKYATYTDHPALNPRTGETHNGWTPVLLATLKSLGVTPDFVTFHRYAQSPGVENDATLLNSSVTWANDAADLRQQLNDYLGAAAAGVELVCTENNSVYTAPGKQTTSLVNGLFLADSLGQAMRTEFNALIWWDARNAQETGNNNSASLYGWRQYGDYGITSGADPAGPADRYPAFYVAKLLKDFARGGDQVVRATSSFSDLAVYATRRVDGTLALLVINKNPSTPLVADIALTGYLPGANATVDSYGIPQDEAARTGTGSADIARTTIANAGTSFTATFAPYSATLMRLSSFSPSPPAIPAAPTGLTATRHYQRGRIGLSWKSTSGATSYNVKRSTTNRGPYATVAAGVTTISYTDTGLASGTTYYYVVTALNAGGESSNSNQASAKAR